MTGSNIPRRSAAPEVREARPADVAEIHRMIGELADYERLRDRFTGPVEALGHHLFGEPVRAHALVGEREGRIQGFALYFFSYSTFLCRPGLYLEDLFVRPDARGAGLGLALLQALEARARQAGCGRFEWSVLDWNQPAIDFYHRYGAHPVGGWTLYRRELL